MKKGLLFLLFTLIAVTGYSQVSWNVKAGMNLSNWSGDQGTDAKVGYKVGAGMEYAFDKTWSLQPSLFLTSKGAKASENVDVDANSDGNIENIGVDVTINQVYMELPVNVQGRFAIANNANIVLAAGPYLAYGIAGKTSGKAKLSDLSYKVEQDTFGDSGLKKFDAGVGVGISLELSKIIVGLEGQWGLTKLGDGEDVPKNINFGINVGYRF